MEKKQNTPEVELRNFLEKNKIAIVPNKPQVTFTEDGGVIIKPLFTVVRLDETT